MTAPGFIRRHFAHWLNQRLPAARRIRLNQQRLFILPTKAGWGFLGLIAILWLLATNYENSPIFAIACLLSSLFITAILHSYANLAGLEISFVAAEPVFAGQRMLFRIAACCADKRQRQDIAFHFGRGDHQVLNLLDSKRQDVLVPLDTRDRGWLRPGRVTVESRYPVGLLRVWTYLDLNCCGLVYPQPLSGSAVASAPATGAAGQKQATVGSDDFAGFKKYQQGMPLQHLSWKHYARERGLLGKEYADAIDERLWLRWQDYPGLDREARLSRLCARVVELAPQQVEYGLQLPGVEVPLGRGDSQRQEVLRQLALFEIDSHEGMI
ncbi:DUF58 domain-containing protein [Porticoccus sp. W117]|uniref:DUF58 domain-containing protein n=1 Tax=Porticoccus sp. W117 TaxID=3054777 RepID=UPI002597AB42|nr:DUF58 domain-containing protein [Porticoccus sp. W117]MDM3871139.1 DUF58 domain-containing protein [Porticoccus sp. W117]